MIRDKKLRLGDILISAGLLTEEQLKKALQHQKMTNQRLGEALVDLHLVTEEEIIRILSKQLQIDYLDLSVWQVDAQIAKIIPEHVAYKYHILPIAREGQMLTLAMSDPLNLLAFEDVEILTGCQIKPMIVSNGELEKILKQVFQKKDMMEKIVEDLGSQYEQHNLEKEEKEEDIDSIPVVRLVNSLMQQATRERASDIHLEPQEKEVIIRFRVDGVLQEKMIWPKHLYGAIASRIKINGGMDIAERRIPQDGRSKIKMESEDVDLRISTLPTIFGEKIVMRLLRTASMKLSLHELGYSEQNLKKIVGLYEKPYGMILVTGPTGSGKTTTLYSILQELNSVDRNITTIEDPVEYHLGKVNQVQINPKAGLNFSNVLRSLLRQDPDIIMVGELRDEETVRIGIQSALTGHLVLSTLHTNDTASTISRLMDMGIEPFLITSSLLGIVAQRLVRKICEHCKESYVLTAEEVERLGLMVDHSEQVMVYRGKGCPHCSGTGYYGRIALGEILLLSSNIRKLILNKASAGEIAVQAELEGMQSLYQSGIEKLLAGETTLQELWRVTLTSH